MKQSKKEPKKYNVVWGAGVNLGGLWSKSPIKFKCFEYTNGYHDVAGDLYIEGLGLTVTNGLITYASPNKAAVEIWISGASSVMQLLQAWSQA